MKTVTLHGFQVQRRERNLVVSEPASNALAPSSCRDMQNLSFLTCRTRDQGGVSFLGLLSVGTTWPCRKELGHRSSGFPCPLTFPVPHGNVPSPCPRDTGAVFVGYLQCCWEMRHASTPLSCWSPAPLNCPWSLEFLTKISRLFSDQFREQILYGSAFNSHPSLHLSNCRVKSVKSIKLYLVYLTSLS